SYSRGSRGQSDRAHAGGRCGAPALRPEDGVPIDAGGWCVAARRESENRRGEIQQMAKNPKLPRGYYWRGGVIWLRTDPVTGRPESTKSSTIAGARAFRERRVLLSSDPSHAVAQERARSELLIDWCARFIELKRAQGKRDSTVQVYQEKLAAVLRGLGGTTEAGVRSLRLSDVTPDAVDAYVARRRASGVRSLTVLKELSALVGVMRAAWRSGAYALDPAKLRPVDLSSDYVPRERALTLDEV